MLGDRQLAYNEKLVRANSLEFGDVVRRKVDGVKVNSVVLEVEKSNFKMGEDDSTSRAVLAKIEEAGARDKVSKNFDESVRVVYGEATFGSDGAVKATETTVYYSEWDVVAVLV